MPSTVDEVAAVMRWCYEHEVPLTARGGGTGLAGGAVPVEGGIVIGFDRLNKVRQFDPLLWRMHVEAGVTTAPYSGWRARAACGSRPTRSRRAVADRGQHRLQRGWPACVQVRRHGHWVTGIEAVVPPGEIVRSGARCARTSPRMT